MTYRNSDVNVIEYNNEYPSYLELTHNMDILFEKYSTEIKAVDEELLEMTFTNCVVASDIEYLRGKKKQILVDVLGEMINWFPQFREYPVMVYLFGSYGRNSNRLYSDIDLNFYYPDEFFSSMLPIEEFFSICLYRLFNLDGRDKVHSMGCLPLVRNIKYKKTPKFSLVFRDGNSLHYEHRRFSLSVMDEIFNMSKELGCIITYLNSVDNSTQFVEWNASISLVYNNSEFVFDDLLNTSSSQLTGIRHRLIEIAKVMVHDFSQKHLFDMNCTDAVTIADFKKTYKTTPSNDLYSVLAMLRVILLSENYNIGYLHIDIFFKDEMIRHILGDHNVERLIDSYYHYYIFLTRIDHIFSVSNEVLSSQIRNKISQLFSIQYRELFKVEFNTDAITNIRNIYQSLYLIEKCLVNYLA